MRRLFKLPKITVRLSGILMRHLGQVTADEVKPEEALKTAYEELSAAMTQQAAEAQ
jgi:hypothetical protein